MPRKKKPTPPSGDNPLDIVQQLLLELKIKGLGTLEGGPITDVDVISSGSIGIDLILGVGGYPKGRIIEIFGPEGSGKTTLTLHAIAECQKAGGVAAFVDAEHALDLKYAKALGIDTSQLLFYQPDSGEDALQVVQKLVESKKVDLIVVDSVAALVPQAELEGNIGDASVGAQARLMGQAMRILCSKVQRSNMLLIFLNQIRYKIGGGPRSNPETTSGGNALRFYASVRLKVNYIGQVKSGDRRYGNRLKISIIKNKVAPPFRTVELDLIFGEGLSREIELITMGIASKAVTRSGSWYSIGEERVAQGVEQAAEYLKEHPEVKDKLREAILASTEQPAMDYSSAHETVADDET